MAGDLRRVDPGAIGRDRIDGLLTHAVEGRDQYQGALFMALDKDSHPILSIANLSMMQLAFLSSELDAYVKKHLGEFRFDAE